MVDHDVFQKPTSILYHTPVGKKNWQISGQKSINVYWLTQLLLRNFGKRLFIHKIGRFLARRASLWSMLFKKSTILAHIPLACIAATFSNFPLLSEGGSSLLSLCIVEHRLRARRASLAQSCMQEPTKIHCH